MDYSSEKDREDLYGALFMTAGSIVKTCLVLGIDRVILYNALRKDEAFAKEFYAIRNHALDGCIDELHRRGYEGVIKAVRGPGGRVVGYERFYDTPALVALLKGLRREFKTDVREISGPEGRPIETVAYEKRFQDLLISDPRFNELAHSILRYFEGTEEDAIDLLPEKIGDDEEKEDQP